MKRKCVSCTTTLVGRERWGHSYSRRYFRFAWLSLPTCLSMCSKGGRSYFLKNRIKLLCQIIQSSPHLSHLRISCNVTPFLGAFANALKNLSTLLKRRTSILPRLATHAHTLLVVKAIDGSEAQNANTFGTNSNRKSFKLLCPPLWLPTRGTIWLIIWEGCPLQPKKCPPQTKPRGANLAWVGPLMMKKILCPALGWHAATPYCHHSGGFRQKSTTTSPYYPGTEPPPPPRQPKAPPLVPGPN